MPIVFEVTVLPTFNSHSGGAFKRVSGFNPGLFGRARIGAKASKFPEMQPSVTATILPASFTVDQY